MLRAIGSWRIGLAAVGVCLLSCLGACEKQYPPVVSNDDMSHLGKILDAYQAATNKLGHPPRSMDDFRPFLNKQGDGNEILVSPNDGEKYVIVWNRKLGQPFDGPPPLIAYEKTGVGGKRNVLTVMGFDSVTDEDFKKYDVSRGQ
jgi:hypothetical protein